MYVCCQSWVSKVKQQKILCCAVLINISCHKISIKVQVGLVIYCQNAYMIYCFIHSKLKMECLKFVREFKTLSKPSMVWTYNWGSISHESCDTKKGLFLWYNTWKLWVYKVIVSENLNDIKEGFDWTEINCRKNMSGLSSGLVLRIDFVVLLIDFVVIQLGSYLISISLFIIRKRCWKEQKYHACHSILRV